MANEWTSNQISCTPHRPLGGNCSAIGGIAADLLACGTPLPQRSHLHAQFCRCPSLDPPPIRQMSQAGVRTSWNECLSQSPTRDKMTMATGTYVAQKMVKNMSPSSSPCMLRSIENAALIEPIWKWPQLIGGRVIGASLTQVTIDHDLSYDALAADEIELRGLVCWPAGECRRGHHHSRGDPCDPYAVEHLVLLQSVHSC
jgi:hypothetical protein